MEHNTNLFDRPPLDLLAILDCLPLHKGELPLQRLVLGGTPISLLLEFSDPPFGARGVSFRELSNLNVEGLYLRTARSGLSEQFPKTFERASSLIELTSECSRDISMDEVDVGKSVGD